MGFVKAIVIGMGVLIVVGFIVIAVTLVMRTQGLSEPEGTYRTTVSLPNGAAIAGTEVGDGEVVLRLREASGGAWLLVLDTDTGMEKGRIKLVPEAP